MLADVPADARILKEEVFGPVAPITGFDTEEEGMAAANDTEYGLAAYIYTRVAGPGAARGRGVESGMVGVNRGVISDAAAPFGGVKESGFGREGGFGGHRGVPRHEVHRADQVAAALSRADAKGPRRSACRGLLRLVARERFHR